MGFEILYSFTARMPVIEGRGAFLLFTADGIAYLLLKIGLQCKTIGTNPAIRLDCIAMNDLLL